MVDIEVKEKLRIIYEDLNNKISSLQSRISYLESLNNTNPVPKNITNTSNSTEKVFKNMDNLSELIDLIPEQSKNFANSIIYNKYPTMTMKQFEALDRIAKEVNFTKPLAK
jgi:uncharacterized membrane protein YgaE (UPF0421/DUF939 family)